jgi:menaquinol-cytochrome c reductase iron-sulfur subunit
MCPDNDQSRISGLTRRQFLTYALGGTGAFMGAAILTPLVGFAFDPVTRGQAGNFVPVGNTTDFNADWPKMVEFKVHHVDGWMQGDVDMKAWIIRKGDSYLAMSPKCTHLGCQVNGSVNAQGQPVPPPDKWFFHCPCHGSAFDKYGINSPMSPAQRPLDVYEVKVIGDTIALGPIHQRTV